MESGMKVSEAIVEVLKREGVDVIFGYPRNSVLEDGAAAGIRPIIVRQERTGIHMADGLSRVTRGERMGVFAMQSGPGTENAYGGIAQAYSESVPVLILPGGYSTKQAFVSGYNATISMRTISKTVEPILKADEIGNIMRRAFTQLRNGRLRPCIVEMTSDITDQQLTSDLVYEPVVRTRSAPDPDAVAKAARTLIDAKRPVIYAGQGVHWAGAWAELAELAELLAIPVCTSLEGKSAFNETHPLALGSGGAAIPKTVRHFLNESDVILGLGCSFGLTPFGVTMPTGKHVIHATLDPADLNKYVIAKEALIGDAQLILRALIDAIRTEVSENRSAEAVAREIKDVEAAWYEEWRPLRESNDSPLSPYRVLKELYDAIDIDNVIVTHDAGSPRDQLTPFWKATTPLSYLGWGKTTQLGYGLGLAMGAKLAHPDKICINVWGDAAIGFTGMDFETAVRERLPILSILLNNQSMAVELPIMPMATERYRATDISGDYAAFARALGGYGERVTKAEEIAGAIARGIEANRNGQAALIEFITVKETRASRL
jgi:acetolactate synthase-1/2/3 large subunit